jgi:hypothetical protein
MGVGTLEDCTGREFESHFGEKVNRRMRGDVYSGDKEDVSGASAGCSSGLQSSGTMAVLTQAEFESSVSTLLVE